ncbi:MAG: hypothetical protein VW397_00925, partial [Candidatus Margulisiibacteriota bacterium]
LPTLVSNEIAPKEMHFMNMRTFKKYTPTDIEIEIRQLTQEHGWFFAWEDHIPKATPKIQNLPKLNNDHIDICGDWTNAGSIEGAMLSGHNAGKRLAKKRT